ncbi:MAG: hypothetical protein JNK82_04945 [Myxococcaceae bacterium]|nr:hypothetical protein [Myxococcaceae bacterium]
MGQLTIYLPDEVEARYRRDAKRAKKTISAYIASLGKRYDEEPKDKNGYPLSYRELVGSIPGFDKIIAALPNDPPEIPDLTPLVPARHRRVQRHRRR